MYLMEMIGMCEHPFSCSPANFAMEGNGECLLDVAFGLEAFEISNPLARCLNLDNECSQC